MNIRNPKETKELKHTYIGQWGPMTNNGEPSLSPKNVCVFPIFM
jgi:hypothetical protein